MKESHGEELATHTGPESCIGVREGAGEALTGVRAGGGIEPRNYRTRRKTGYSEVPTPWR